MSLVLTLYSKFCMFYYVRLEVKCILSFYKEQLGQRGCRQRQESPAVARSCKQRQEPLAVARGRQDEEVLS